MRVVLTCNFSPWSSYSGGGQRSTHELATQLARMGHDTHVIFTRPRWEHFAVPETAYRLHWAGFFDYKSRRQAPLRPLNALTVARQVGALHRASPINVLHGNGEEVALAARWAKARGVFVITTPRYPNYPEAMLAPGGLSLAQRMKLLITDAKYLVLAHAVKHSNLCCPTSSYTKGQIERALGADPARLCVVPNGVARAFLERQWRPSAQPRTLLFFGRLEHDKGLDLLLHALARLKTPQRLVVAGRGGAAEQLEALATKLGVAPLVDWQPWLSKDALASVLADSALAVLPSRHESFGNAMAEAMAVGTPLISTQAGSIPEVVEHGRSGWLVPPDSPDALATAIEHLLARPELCLQLSTAARARVHATYTWERVAERYTQLYGAHH